MKGMLLTLVVLLMATTCWAAPPTAGQEGLSASDLTNHEADTTSIHGIIDTSKLIATLIEVVEKDDAETLTPTGTDFNHTKLTCSTNPSAITVSKANATDGDLLLIKNVGSNVCTLPWSSGVFEFTGGQAGDELSLSQNTAVLAEYNVDRWIVISGNIFLKFLRRAI